MKKILVLTIIPFIFLSCSTMDTVYLQKQQKKALLSGMVISENGLPVEGARVKLTPLIDTKTDINGRFLFNYMRFGKYTITAQKNGYTSGEYELEFNYKNKNGIPFVKIKIFSLNYLINEGFELLKEKRTDDAKVILEELEKMDSGDETIEYFKAMYFYSIGEYHNAQPILEKLKDKDRKNIYYQLTLLDVYQKLRLFYQQIDLSLYIARNNPREYNELIKEAALVYKTSLNQEEDYTRLMNEYEENRRKYNLEAND